MSPAEELAAIDARVVERDRSRDGRGGARPPRRSRATACPGSTPTRPVMPVLWYREGMRSAVETATSGPRAGERTMAETTYLEAIRQGLFEEMERDPDVILHGRGHRRLRRCVQGDRGAAWPASASSGSSTRRSREAGIRRRGGRRRPHGHAAGVRDAVHRLHLLRLRHAHQLRRHRALPRVPALSHGGARPQRRATSAAARSTRRTPRRRSSTRRASRSSTRPRRATPRG